MESKLWYPGSSQTGVARLLVGILGCFGSNFAEAFENVVGDDVADDNELSALIKRAQETTVREDGGENEGLIPAPREDNPVPYNWDEIKAAIPPEYSPEWVYQSHSGHTTVVVCREGGDEYVPWGVLIYMDSVSHLPDLLLM